MNIMPYYNAVTLLWGICEAHDV